MASHDLAAEARREPPGMDADSSEGLHVVSGNRTGGEELQMDNGALALKVFNMAAASVIGITLIITGIVCLRAWHKHSRQYRRAQEYETSVKTRPGSSPAVMSGMRRIINIHRSIILMRKLEKPSPQVYFIYSNLAMNDEEPEKPPEDQEPPIATVVAPGDVTSSGVILNPRAFYV